MKKVTCLLIITLLLPVALVAWTSIGVVPVRIGNHREVRIGDQIWMAQNLDVKEFRNGDPIPQAKNRKEWNKASWSKQPVWCYYKDDPKNGEKYGKLYNWYAVIDPRGLAPEGWHVPTSSEWGQLTTFLGGEKVAGEKLKSANGWYHDRNGNDLSAFSGLPGGVRGSELISGKNGFRKMGKMGIWWSATIDAELDIFAFILTDDEAKATNTFVSPSEGLSVRCVKD